MDRKQRDHVPLAGGETEAEYKTRLETFCGNQIDEGLWPPPEEEEVLASAQEEGGEAVGGQEATDSTTPNLIPPPPVDEKKGKRTKKQGDAAVPFSSGAKFPDPRLGNIRDANTVFSTLGSSMANAAKSAKPGMQGAALQWGKNVKAFRPMTAV
ncbi:MAG: peroxisomal assembly protein [Watsoniomyces obsoletus]|nr:MAG: peroxisomal assembly protein [Watsoniomyces obsoletus]